MTREEFNEWLKKNNFNDLNSTDFFGASPAHRAAWDGNISALRYIAEHAPKLLSETTLSGERPAHYAARSGNFDSLEFIAEHAPKTFSMKDNHGETPIHKAAARVENINSFKLLAAYAPETLKMKDESGYTPVHEAARNGNVKALEFLMEEEYGIFAMQESLIGNPVCHAMEMLKSSKVLDLEPEKYIQILKLYAEHAPQTLNGEIFTFLVKEAPESLPIFLFDKSKKHEEILTSIFDSIKNDMRENYNGTKNYLQKCEAEISLINKFVDEKTKEYQEKNPLESVLSKLGRGKGE